MKYNTLALTQQERMDSPVLDKPLGAGKYIILSVNVWQWVTTSRALSISRARIAKLLG